MCAYLSIRVSVHPRTDEQTDASRYDCDDDQDDDDDGGGSSNNCDDDSDLDDVNGNTGNGHDDVHLTVSLRKRRTLEVNHGVK